MVDSMNAQRVFLSSEYFCCNLQASSSLETRFWDVRPSRYKRKPTFVLLEMNKRDLTNLRRLRLGLVVSGLGECHS